MYKDKMTIRDVSFQNKRVLMRVDFNVPLKDGKVADDTRITAALPSIQYILKQSPKQLVLVSHLGRPKGKVKEELRLNSVAERLQQLLNEPVRKLDDCVGEHIVEQLQQVKEKVVLLENLLS